MKIRRSMLELLNKLERERDETPNGSEFRNGSYTENGREAHNGSYTENRSEVQNGKAVQVSSDANETAEYRLGAAMLARIGIPEGKYRDEAVERILMHWEGVPMDAENPEAKSMNVSNEGRYEAKFGQNPNMDANDASDIFVPGQMSEGDRQIAGDNGTPRLPRPIRGTYGEVPAADYESMSAEQFRRLKKQLRRAVNDGRRVKL